MAKFFKLLSILLLTSSLYAGTYFWDCYESCVWVQENGWVAVTKKSPTQASDFTKGWTCHEECNLLFYDPYNIGVIDNPNDPDGPGSDGPHGGMLDSNYDGKIDCYKNTLPNGNWNTGRAFNPPTHYGIDGAAETGTPVYSGMSGTVSQVLIQMENGPAVQYDPSRHYFEYTGETWSYNGHTYFEVWLRDKNDAYYRERTRGGGLYVKVVNESGESFYAMHLSSSNVQPGQQVSVGNFIGQVGNTGGTYSTTGGDGSHLHIGYKDSSGTWQDPAAFLGNDCN